MLRRVLPLAQHRIDVIGLKQDGCKNNLAPYGVVGDERINFNYAYISLIIVLADTGISIFSLEN